MKKLIFTLMIASYFFPAQAQKKTIDSLKHAIMRAKDDTSRVMLMNSLSRAYLYARPDSSLLIAQQSEYLSKTLKFRKGEAISLDREGIAFSTMGNYPRSLTCLIASLKIAEEIKDKREIAVNTFNIATMYEFSGDSRQSITYTKKSQAVIEALPDDKMLAKSFINLGDSYERLNILDSARLNSLQAYRYAVKLKETV